MTIDPDALDALLHPTFDPKAPLRGARLRASTPRRARPRARSCSPPPTRSRPPQEGRDVILVRPFTDAEDVAGFHAAKGILTSEGGKASHAALVARGMGRPAVVGAQALEIDLDHQDRRRSTGPSCTRATAIAIDGTKGQVTADDVPLVEAQVDENFEQVLAWADEVRRMNVRTNADTPEDAREGPRVRRRGHRPVPDRAHVHGRGPPAQDAGDDHGRRPRVAPRRAGRAAAAPAGGLRGHLRRDGRAAGDDPPARPAAARVPPQRRGSRRRDRACPHRGRPRPAPARAAARPRPSTSPRRTRCSAPAACRLGILYPEIYEMQVHAILRAAKAADEPPHPEIMIPLVDYEHELEIMRELVAGIGDEEGLEIGDRLHRRHDDRAAPGLLRGRPHRPASPTSSASAPTT